MIPLREYVDSINEPIINVIYIFSDPITNEVRYIGKAKNLLKRILNHYKPSKLKLKTHKNNWLKSLLENGLRPNVCVIDSSINYCDLNSLEIKWIEYYTSIGCDLTNGTKGGDGGMLTPESIEKMKATKKRVGQKYWASGRKFTDEHKKNISISKEGVKLSDKHKESLSQSHKGINTWSKGVKLSDETKNKMSKSRTGKIKNTEPVYQLDLNGNVIKMWDYPTKAEKELNLNRSKIHSVCTGKRKTTGGFIWCYVKDYNINLFN